MLAFCWSGLICVLFGISPNQKLCATTTSNDVKRKKWVLWMLGFVKFDSFLYCLQQLFQNSNNVIIVNEFNNLMFDNGPCQF